MLIKILDTNVLLDRDIKETINAYGVCEIVIPLVVIEELDSFKSLQDDRGRFARSAIRFMDDLRQHGSLSKGIELENGSTFRIDIYGYSIDIPDNINIDKVDTKILMVAKGLTLIHGDEVELVTQDICERILADAMGIKADSFSIDGVQLEEVYSGYAEVKVTDDQIQKFNETGRLRIVEDLIANQFVGMVDELHGVTYGKYDVSIGAIVPLERGCEAFGLRAKRENIEQKFFMDLLLNDEINLVTAIGKAGTGKTVISLACGLQKVLEERKYDKIIVSRATIPIGEELGFLPGTKEEKLIPWMGATFDNLEFLCKDMSSRQVDGFIEDCIELEAMTYIRGRSIPKQWIIIDEAQNITKDQIKTIITRAGEGTKIIVIGDVEQVDNHRLNSSNNGLVHLINAFKGQPIYGHVTLTKTERSLLSELAATLL